MNSYPIYRFVSLRSPNSNFSTPATHEVEYIPRQYSPAIIADSCDGTMVTP